MHQYELKRNKQKLPASLNATQISDEQDDSDFASSLSIIKEMDRPEETKR